MKKLTTMNCNFLRVSHGLIALSLATHFTFAAVAADSPAQTELKSLSVNGGLQDGKARLVIEGELKGLGGDTQRFIHATALQHSIHATVEKLSHTFRVHLDIIQGEPKEIPLVLSGAGEIRQVTGDTLQDWSIRQETGGLRHLVLRPKKSDKPITSLSVAITADTELKDVPTSVTPLALVSTQPALSQGFVRVDADPALDLQAANPTGLIPVEPKFLPPEMRATAQASEAEPLAFRFHGAGYSLPLKISVADPETRRVVLAHGKLIGQLGEATAAFTLTGTARVKNPKGGTLDLLSGGVALTELGANAEGRLKIDQGRFVLTFDQAGEFPIHLQFNAAVRQAEGWNSIDFRVAPSALQTLLLQGLPADTQFRLAGGARPERSGNDFASFLPANGQAQLSWKTARPEAEGKLFYAAEMLSQIAVSPGLARQWSLVEGKVMQGELNRLGLRLRGQGEVTRVLGEGVLAWNVESITNSTDRRLAVQFNQPQKDQFVFQVQMQMPLGAFPQAFDPVQLRPEGATRFAGHVRVVNEGAVRLEVLQASGLSQISPEQFPESDATKELFRTQATQRFAFRFSGAEYQLRVQADNVLLELAVSQLIAYHLGDTELNIEVEIELDIREAPLRELVLRVPNGYAIARLTASGLSDYFLKDEAGQPDAELRLVYGQPISARQIVQFRLERNQPLGATNWTLPRIEVAKAKSVRGHVGISADSGFRLTATSTEGLTELATAFFPRKIAGIQAAFRISEPAWQAALRVERLPQSIQAEAVHLFSIGEGIAYGSSIVNYHISGAPISTFRIELSAEYFNVEFTGKDVRNWQKTTNGFEIQLHTPVAGPYTLLATYERPFKGQGETLTFTGARPLDAQSEQGHTILVSAYQFQVRPSNVSTGLLPLEAAEVPAEYRLFFNAPILAAYRYSARPFNLQLVLSPLTQGQTLKQVADRAAFTTRISKEGQVLTDARYYVKNRGQSHFRLTLPEGTQLWSATVNGVTAVPVADAKTNLIPLPQRADPSAVHVLDLKLAARSQNPKRVTVSAPVVDAPVLLAEWKLEPDTGQRLVYRQGSLTPVGGEPDGSGFAGLARLFRGHRAQSITRLGMTLALMVIAFAAWSWAAREGSYKYGARHLAGALVGLVAFGWGSFALAGLGTLAGQEIQGSRAVMFVAPVQQAGSALSAEVANLAEKPSGLGFLLQAWPAALAFAVWIYRWLTSRAWFKSMGVGLGWTLLAWAALRWPNGAQAFFFVVLGFLFVHVVVPALRRLWQLPPAPEDEPPTANATAPAVIGLLLMAFVPFAHADHRITLANAHPSQNQRLDQTLLQVQQSLVGEARPLLLAQAAPGSRATGQSKAAISPAPGRSQAGDASTPRPKPVGPSKDLLLAESVIQEIRVEDEFVFATAKIRWPAKKDQLLPVLFEPAVLTRIVYPTNALKLVQAGPESKRSHQLLAQQSGLFDVELRYQIHTRKKDGESGFALPTQFGLVNHLTLTLAGLDVDVAAPQAVSIQRAGGRGAAVNPDPVATAPPVTDTVAKLVLSPVNEAWIGWKPRSRDTRHEKAVFYAEIFQLYVPSAGVIEGAHQVQIRPAQGELGEMTFDVPAGSTITDVLDPVSAAAPVDAKAEPLKRLSASIVSLWRFDPDTRKLRVNLNPAQARPFALVIKSQIATGPLPFDQKVGLISVSNAAGQIGVLGVATGNEVQLDAVDAGAFSAINLEDFPAWLLRWQQSQTPGLTLRRAYRYADPAGMAALKASPVEPDVRVESQQTLSLGEDRAVLAASLAVEITRAGIFRLSFVLPAGMDLESVSGQALSHWTELKTDQGRIITLHLRGKTEGQQPFTINLAGPGVRAATNWAVPKLVFREAGKERGQLVIVPEQGLRLQVGAREGVTQLDPQQAGIRQRGVLAFRLLHGQWNLALGLEQVDAWIQVNSLQHVSVNEAQVKVNANLQYQIENTGLKTLRVRLPANADGVRFTGEQVADFLAAGAATEGMQIWEVKLHRRVLGSYLLQVAYQFVLPPQARQTEVRGVQAEGVNLQRGFLTLQSGGRLQLRAGALPAALQPAEWQSIPRALRQDAQAAAANYTFRLAEPAFQLPVQLERHEAAKLLPARVNSVTLTSVISDAGVMLTQARLELTPGDKRLLHLTLPTNVQARFWFAFVNQNGVWPWLEQDRILIPLDQPSRNGQATVVDLFYSSQAGSAEPRALDLELLGPKFDLPLENISWRVFLNEKWQLKKWTGSLQLGEEITVVRPAVADVNFYLKNEASLQSEKTREAEQFLQMGNTLLQQGDPNRAQQAFQAAYGLSQHDDAFNEDARVQLHNLKMQQALVGLSVRQSSQAPDPGGAAAKLRELRDRKSPVYTQAEAKQIIDRNAPEENAALMRLAERLIQQQEAALASPTAIRTTIPEQGRLLTFHRAVQVDTWADLRIGLQATAAHGAPAGMKLLVLAGVFFGFLLVAWIGRGLRTAD